MAKVYDSVEIGLTRAELRQALRKWVDAKTMIQNYKIGEISIHAGAKYVVRFSVEPPLEKADEKAIMELKQTA